MGVKARVAQKLSGRYEYRYDIDSTRQHFDIDTPILNYHYLTGRQQYQNQFHNELQVMVALEEVDNVPKVLDFDLERLALAVEDVGTPLRSVDRLDLDEMIDTFANIHDTLNRATPKLRDVFTTVVDQMFYFTSARGWKEHDEGAFGDILHDIPQIVDRSERYNRRIAHGDANISNVLVTPEAVSVVDFEETCARFQMNDLVGVL